MKPAIPDEDYKAKYIQSEDRFRKIFSLTSAATKIIDENLVIVEVNDALTDLLGYPKEEICGRKIMDFACKQYIESWENLQREMWIHGKPFFKLEACLKTKGGGIVWVHVTTIVFSDGNKRFAYTVLDDYTFMKSYLESEKRLNMSLQYSRMAVFELNLKNGEFIHSEGINEILGIKANKVQLDRDSMVGAFINDDAAEIIELLNNMPDDGSIDFVGRVKIAPNVLKWVHLQARMEPGESNTTKLLGTVQDISKEKQADQYKDDFISIASHELRTPITILSGTLQLLERNKPKEDPKLSGLIDQANKGLKKVTILIEDLLNASKMNEGQLHLNKKPFNIVEAVNECCAHINREGIYKIIVEGDLSADILGDSDRIQQVIINFVNNAIKYAPDEKIIRIKAVDQGDTIKISVIDSGPGIDYGKAAHLFDRYYRVDSKGIQYSGLGLGLYISAEIIKKHGGKIGLTNNNGAGSEFWFVLPK
ncbi:PAS domain S-box protein [Pedobacter petrophilus]|uniref:histidine kinase n=1 Tax=Pedobacter petrophilus TaxID=1908241 RepID=A0A7K0FY73_9SPHI|nr:PAS domain-containing sensor histidine kinase [Pedobacter petrophilus]MRX76475.1 PAS domain S-box protein [Pedobacter petrophilus]